MLTAMVGFTLVATGASIVANRIAQRDALQEALRSAHVVSNTVFAPLIPAVMQGDAAAVSSLDSAVRIRSRDGSILRIKVWSRDGTVIYSDDHSAIGGRFPLNAKVARAIDNQRDEAEISSLNDPENLTEFGLGDRLVEVYIPLNLDNGTHLAFEMYSTDKRVLAAERSLRSQLVPFGLAALTLLVLLQLPVSVWLVRRVGAAQAERSRLLNSALLASDRERRAIVQDLHDGVVQELAAARYAADALASRLPETTDQQSTALVEGIRGVLGSSVGALRTLMVDIYPRDLSAAGLHDALSDLTRGLTTKTGADATVQVDLPTEPSPEIVAMLYRTAREGLANVAAHARATAVRLRVDGDERLVRLLLHDNGVGVDPASVDKRAEGHFGLRTLVDAAADLGGYLRIQPAVEGGTDVELELPTDGLRLA